MHALTGGDRLQRQPLALATSLLRGINAPIMPSEICPFFRGGGQERCTTLHKNERYSLSVYAFIRHDLRNPILLEMYLPLNALLEQNAHLRLYGPINDEAS